MHYGQLSCPAQQMLLNVKENWEGFSFFNFEIKSIKIQLYTPQMTNIMLD